MAWRDRQGNVVPGDDSQDATLKFLYETALGRKIVGILVKPWVSELAGKVMDSGISRVAIGPFLRKSNINMEEYENRRFRSFNDFFTRQLRPGARTLDLDPAHMMCPCDCKVSVYPITQTMRFRVKGVEYTLGQLLNNESLAHRYAGGTFLLLRLTVDDYHRYCYADGGKKGENIRIPGVYHTVNPIAGKHYGVYRENTREYTLIENPVFGTILQMEVGATMVGRIVNYQGSGMVRRGQEKGRFEFGGSTVILCLEKDRVRIDGDLVENTRQGQETVVKLGQRIGTKP